MDARNGLHGFNVQKGTFVDGHERDDVVQYRKRFLRRMVALGFFNTNNAPTEEAKQAIPDDLECPPQVVLEKMVVFFHDESTFQCNDNQSTFWGMKGTHIIH